MSKIADSIVAAAKTASTFPTGRKLDDTPSKTMALGAECLGPATSAPDVTTQVGSIETIVIAPADDPNHEPPDIWQHTPTWLLGQRL